jgi:hypothetical protein
VDDVRAPVVSLPEPEIEAAAQPLDVRDLAVAIEVAHRLRHLALPRKLQSAQPREEEEGDGEDQDESEKRSISLQDSTR